jgi:FlaA1/EpsC-like NDP-sugar epimerase
VAVEDLLGRKPVQLDQHRIRERIQGKVVLVTGAGGSIGSEICRQLPNSGRWRWSASTPRRRRSFRSTANWPFFPRTGTFHPEIGSITRPDTLRRVMQQYQPSIVYHAAAYKHVSMMERHVFAAVENNIFGTWQVALAAANHGVEDFVMISTDKAVRPTSMMGATKRMAELVIRALQIRERHQVCRGPLRQRAGQQRQRGSHLQGADRRRRPGHRHPPGDAPLLHDHSRSGATGAAGPRIGKGGEVFVLDMGESVKIVDLARNLILLSGLQPDRDIKIEFTGMRPGEKLFEELNLA